MNGDGKNYHLKNREFNTLCKEATPHNTVKKSSKNSKRWSVFSSTQNLPAVLSDPKKGIKRDFFTKLFGENFTESEEIRDRIVLPTVTNAHVESYIRKLCKRNQVLLRFKEQNKDLCHQPSTECHLKTVSAVQKSVPDLYLSLTFNLQHPSTFYSVFTHITSSGISRKQANALQEKLFSYLEIVEQEMSEQIVKKSFAFFHTMTYLNAQVEQLRQSHCAVLSLRKSISNLRKDVILKPLKISALPVQKANMESTIKKLEAMSTVREVQSTIQVTLARQEYSSALDIITTTQELISSELSSLKSLRHLNSELSEHVRLIQKMVSIEFSKYVSDELHRPLADKEGMFDEDRLLCLVTTLLRLERVQFLDILKDSGEAVINVTVKQAVAEAVSEIEGDHEATNAADQARSLSLFVWLSLLAQLTSDLHVLLQRVQSIVAVIEMALEASSGQSSEGPSEEIDKVVVLIGSESVLSNESYVKLKNKLQFTLESLSEYAHDRCAKLLHARSRDNGLDKMSTQELLTLSKLVEDFVDWTSEISKAKCSPFRAGLHGLASRFVRRFHDDRSERLRLTLGSERWKAVSVPPDFQDLVNHVTANNCLGSSTNFVCGGVADDDISYALTPQDATDINSTSSHHDSASYDSDPTGRKTTTKQRSSIILPLTTSASSDSVNNTTAPANCPAIADTSTSIPKVCEGVTVGGEEFVVVGVCLVVIRLMLEYSECASTLRLAASQLLGRLVEVLRKFNADTCRLLIEAGAVSLGLKTITIRNLALALRSLQLLMTFIPKLTHHFELLKVNSANKHFSQLHREYSDHCNALEAKIVTIMRHSLNHDLSSWEAKSPVPSKSFGNILKSLSKLHETVVSILPPKKVEDLFAEITTALKSEMNVHLTRLSVSPIGPQCWVVTSELTFYFNHLTTLGITLKETQEQFLSHLWKKNQAE